MTRPHDVHAVSPLAPKQVPDLPAIAGVRLATAEAGIRYAGRTDVLLALFEPGTATAGVFTKSKCPSAPVEWCRDATEIRQSARAGGQFRQRQCLHRQKRARGDQAHRRDRRQGGRLQAGGRLPRLHRGDRRAARCDQVRPRHGQPRRARQTRRLPRRRQGDHDHRHLSQGRDRDGAHRQGDGDRQRHRQGRRHDRARYGDHALLRVHRCRDRGAGAAGAA